MLHGSLVSFHEKISKFKWDHPNPPTSSNVRGRELLSLDCYFNERLVKAISINLSKTKILSELTICGLNLSLTSAETFN